MENVILRRKLKIYDVLSGKRALLLRNARNEIFLRQKSFCVLKSCVLQLLGGKSWRILFSLSTVNTLN